MRFGSSGLQLSKNLLQNSSMKCVLMRWLKAQFVSMSRKVAFQGCLPRVPICGNFFPRTQGRVLANGVENRTFQEFFRKFVNRNDFVSVALVSRIVVVHVADDYSLNHACKLHVMYMLHVCLTHAQVVSPTKHCAFQ